MSHDAEKPEPYRTYHQAAEMLGLSYATVQRAARRGIIPTYSLLNGRRFVLVSDIVRIMSELQSSHQTASCHTRSARHV